MEEAWRVRWQPETLLQTLPPDLAAAEDAGLSVLTPKSELDLSPSPWPEEEEREQNR